MLELTGPDRARILEHAAEAAQEWERADSRLWVPRWKHLNHVEQARLSARAAVIVDAVLSEMPDPSPTPAEREALAASADFLDAAGYRADGGL